MIIFIHGADSFSSRQYLETIINQFKQKHDPDGRAVSFFTEESGSWDDLARELTGSDLFIKKRLIVAKDVLGRKDIFDGLGDFFERASLGDDVTLIVYQSGAVDKRLKLIKKLSTGQLSREFELPKPLAVERFIRQRLQAAVKKIEEAAVRALSEIVGPDLWRAQAEVDKLSHLPQANITLVDIRQTVAASPDNEIWPLLDAISDGNKNAALRLLEEQVAVGVEAPYLSAMLARQTRLLLALRDSSESDAALASALSLKPYVVTKTRPQARNFTTAKLKLMYQALLRLDAALKTGRGEPSVLFTVLLDSIVK